MLASQGAWPARSGLRTAGAVAAAAVESGRRTRGAALGLAAFAAALVLRRRPLRRHYLGPLQRRSCVLRGARVELHAAHRLPDAAAAWLRGTGELWLLDVTVRPDPLRAGPGRWRPCDLEVVARGARAGSPEEDEEAGRIVAARVWRRGRFERAGERALVGPQRLELHVALRPGLRRFHLRYFLEILGRVPAGAPRDWRPGGGAA
jgi:hypothetical protein